MAYLSLFIKKHKIKIKSVDKSIKTQIEITSECIALIRHPPQWKSLLVIEFKIFDGHLIKNTKDVTNFISNNGDKK